MNNLIERIFKNWKTTLLGFLIILASIAAVFVGKATLTESGIFIVTGISFFFLKDSNDK